MGKKLLAILLSVLLIITITGCNKKDVYKRQSRPLLFLAYSKFFSKIVSWEISSPGSFSPNLP